MARYTPKDEQSPQDMVDIGLLSLRNILNGPRFPQELVLTLASSSPPSWQKSYFHMDQFKGSRSIKRINDPIIAQFK